MRVWRKVTGIALALMLVLAMSVTAFATDPVTTNGTSLSTTSGSLGEQDDVNSTISDEKVTLAKEITAYNAETVNVNAPTISYTYTIAGAT